MTVPVPYTWSDDELTTHTLLNLHVRDPQLWMLGLPLFRARNTTQLTIPNAAWTNIPMNTEDVKVKFTHAANDTKVYATEPGWYRWMIKVCFVHTTTGGQDNRGILLRKNASAALGEPGGGYTSHLTAANADISIGPRSGFVYLNGTTDYVELQAYQSTGSATDVLTGVANLEWQSVLALFWQGRDLT